jgi:hypothetical protein
MGGKRSACSIIGHALDQANADVRTNRYAGALQRGKQRTLRHDTSSPRLQTLLGPLENVDSPSLPNEHVAGEHAGHRAADDNGLFHRPSLYRLLHPQTSA